MKEKVFIVIICTLYLSSCKAHSYIDTIHINQQINIIPMDYNNGCLNRGLRLSDSLESDTLYNNMISLYFSSKLFDNDCEWNVSDEIFERSSFFEVARYFCDTLYSSLVCEKFKQNDCDYFQSNLESIFNGIPLKSLYKITEKSIKWNKTPYGIYALWNTPEFMDGSINVNSINGFDEYLASLDVNNIFIQLELICFLHSIGDLQRFNYLKHRINCIDDYKGYCEIIFAEIEANDMINYEKVKSLLYY